ncbi:hypothetical protein DFH09DRAFT_1282842 [Mycena vulgaris]|nr:hypothetical protein DFH09DRAFT_1282842 [Mycena vulgaris]
MPHQRTVTEIRLNNIVACLTPVLTFVKELHDVSGTPFFPAITSTTLDLITAVQKVKKNKEACVRLMEDIYGLLCGIINLHIQSGNVGTLPPATLAQIGKFTEYNHYRFCPEENVAKCVHRTLNKISTFIEVQVEGNVIKHFFRQSEISTLLKDCQAGLQQAKEVFMINGSITVFDDIAKMQKKAQEMHEHLLEFISTLSDRTTSDDLSSMYQNGNGSSANSFLMLPGRPKIFHGRDSELENVVQNLIKDSPRVAILGAGGMGKTSLARAALHHPEIAGKYQQCFFVGCDSATTTLELADLIGAQLGLQTGKDLTTLVAQYFARGPSCLLILDNLETAWEPLGSRAGVEEFLSLLTDVAHLALVITMRGAERPAKVRWTRPFLLPLSPLTDDAARQTFIDIADDFHDKEEVNELLQLTDNMPLAVDLIAHLVDYEGCPNILARWKTEKTSLLSEGHDKRSSLDASITVSLSSPRMKARPGAMDLLRLLAILPDGLSDIELLQSDLPIQDLLGCKTLLLGTSLAYIDDRKRLKSLVPIREHIHHFYAPSAFLIKPMHQYYQVLLDILEADFITEVFNSMNNQLIANPEALVSQAKSHFSHFHDPLLESSMQYLERAITLGSSCGNHTQHASALTDMAGMKWEIGDYIRAREDAHEALRLSKLSGNSYQTARALWTEASCYRAVGDYTPSVILLRRARELLELCSMSDGDIYTSICMSEAETHLLKSEYGEARRIYMQIFQDLDAEHDMNNYASGLMNIARIDVAIDSAVYDDVHQNLERANTVLRTFGKHFAADTECEMLFAGLKLRAGDPAAATSMFRKCLNLSWARNTEAVKYCLEGLAYASHCSPVDFNQAWNQTVIYFAYAQKSKQKLELHKALRLLGDLFMSTMDVNTASNLFLVALEGFTQMDVHQGRADSMLRLGDVEKQRGDLPKATQLWREARPLFERSLQSKGIALVDARLDDVKEKLASSVAPL